MSRPAPLVLVVEDSPVQAVMAQAMLRELGHRMVMAGTAAAGLEAALREPPDAILLDLELPDGSGFGLMRRLRAEGIDCAVIVITANASISVAVEAMREGAVDFIVKPYAKARLTVTLQNALEKRALASELREVKAQLARDRFFGFIGASPAMQAVYRTIESVAASKANVFITGESGTGKELAAEAVHRASPRRARGFVALNCGAIPRDLLESEIFGHVKGAFTGATDNRVGAAKQADGGTLFLDEIGEMPLEMQVKLLRFVQTGSFQPVGASKTEKVDARIVSATNRDPWAEVEAGRFREDLYYRLYVVPVEMPPLRDRGEDVLLVARHFLAAFAKEEGKRFSGFSREAEAALLAYGWPGNVRQLQNVVRNIVVLHDGERVEPAMLPPALLRGGGRPTMAAAQPAAPPAPPVAAPLVTPVATPVVTPAADPLPAPAADPPPPPAAVPPPPSVAVALAPPAAPQPATPAAAAPDPDPPADPPPPAPAPPAIAVMPPPAPPAAAPAPPAAPPPPDGVPPEVWTFDLDSMKAIEKRAILAALLKTGHDVPRAAALLEINPSTIYRRLIAWRGEGSLPPLWDR